MSSAHASPGRQHHPSPHDPTSRRPSSRHRRTALAATGLVLSGALVLAGTGAASAHVTVSSPDAAPGGFGKLVFRVPSESETASTTRVQVTLPAATPFAFVSTRPVPGWTVTTTERRLTTPVKAEGFTLTKAVATVTWTAEKGQGLRPGEFDEFEVSVGPFPEKAGSLELPAVQTYSDGSTVAWDQPSTPGGTEPEHPAPTLEVAAAAATTAARSSDTAAQSSSSAGTTDAVARWLGGVGLLLGAAGLGVAVLSRRRSAA